MYAADVTTGEGAVLVPAADGRQAIGLDVQTRTQNLWVAGGQTGQGYVYDARTGDEVAVLELTDPGTFVNDVIVTEDAAYFTDSFLARFYRVPLNADGSAGDPEIVDLGGDWEQIAGFNANGIVAVPGGSALLIINSSTGVLYKVDPRTGSATAVDSDVELTAGDGMALRGSRLYVVRNRDNQIVELQLSRSWTVARQVEVITDPGFDVPTTVAAQGGNLYAVNARFGTPPTPETTYTITAVSG